MRPRALLPAAMLLLSAVSAATPTMVHAQSPAQVRDELLMQFDASMSKFIALAKEMPAERFTWAPGPRSCERSSTRPAMCGTLCAP